MLTLDTAVSALGPVAKRRAELLSELGLDTVRDVLLHFPSRHENFQTGTPLAEIEPGTNVSVIAQVVSARSRPRFGRRMSISEATLTDGTAEIKAIWFNQPYRAKSLTEGKSFRFSGKVTQSKFGVQLQNPQVEAVSGHIPVVAHDADAADAIDGEVVGGADLLPVYPTTNGITQQTLRFIARSALPAVSQLADPLPEHFRSKYGLPTLAEAVRWAHFPASSEDVAKARRRIGFDEMLRMQLSIGKMRRLRQARPAPKIPFDELATKAFVKSLPFALTDDQRKAGWAVLKDMTTGFQMHRLLDGDVGSGKTVVSAIAMMNVARADYQSALMAPTEILAAQHFATLAKFFKRQPFTVAIWTQSYKRAVRGGKEIVCKTKKEVEKLGKEIADGEIAVVVGTHALVEDALKFNALALAVVDEQHRFGVRLRSLLVGKSGIPDVEPHLLSMTATPIPRSLALAMFGDLDLSLLKEKPKGRIEIETRLVLAKERGKAYEKVREEVADGRQAFVVCPLIDPSDVLGATSVTEEYENLRKKELKGIALGMLHGKMSSDDKEKVMADFLAKKIMVLVATSVVEVGVDVPNASVMCIEGAERFGLSQLHQFRGRIGRGEHPSFCFLLPSMFSPNVKERMMAVVRHKDGFSLAEKDLQMRGPGDILGTAQSGFPEFLMAAFADARLIADAKQAAEALLEEDPELERHEGLRKDLKAAAERVHLE